MRRRGKSAAYLKRLRKRYRLGEYAHKKRKKKGALGYPGNTPKERFFRSIGVPEIGYDE